MVKESVERKNHYGHGRNWYRGEMIGKGSSGSVYLATLKKPKARIIQFFPKLMAVKLAEISDSGSLQKERMVLSNLGGCPYISKCFGEEITTGERGDRMVYNLLLEYGSGGTLANLIKKSGGVGLPEADVKLYTKCVLLGIQNTHVHGYVHRDLQPQNIILFPCTKTSSGYIAKISDYGSAKMVKNIKKMRLMDPYLRGKIKYLLPEAVINDIQEPPSDIWALGCIVVEMLTGKSLREGKTDSEIEDILYEIGKGRGGISQIPNEVSKEAKDFLKGCFVTKSMNRLTAEKLLGLPFVAGILDGAEDKEEIARSDGSRFIAIPTNIYRGNPTTRSRLPHVILAGA